MGRLIPAGTGLARYRNIRMVVDSTDAEYQSMHVAKEPLEEQEAA